jgi:hypothetical protein
MVLHLQPKSRFMAKFKFKGTTTEDVEEELEKLCRMDAKEIPLNHIIKVVKTIGVDYIEGENTGSLIRFQHPDVETFCHYFGVHKEHKGGKGEDMVLKRNFKQYMMPHLKVIIAKRKAKGI